MYAKGRGVPLDNTKAMELYLKAANQGDDLAQQRLGIYFMMCSSFCT